MSSDLPKTLADFKLPTFKIDCTQCGRRGQYNIKRAIERYGAGMTIREFFVLKASTCPYFDHPLSPVKCSAGCSDLIYMWNEAPKFSGAHSHSARPNTPETSRE